MIFRFLILIHKARENRAWGIASLLGLLLVSLVGNSLCFYFFDGADNPEIGLDDAFWYSVISVTTIGYGDYSATTLGARIGTVLFIVLLGLLTFTIFLGMMIDWATDMILKGQRGMATIHAKDHVLLVNFPSEDRVAQLIDELRSDAIEKNREIVLISKDLEQNPFSDPKISFVRGSTIEESTYERAGIRDAHMALVLATSYSDPNSDAVVASTVSVIDAMNPDLHIVAECLNDKHRMLFDAVRCNAIVPGLRIVSNLLVQEIHDPGIAQMLDAVTSNLTQETLYSARVSEAGQEAYSEIAKRLLEREITLICVNRGKKTTNSLKSLYPVEGDRVIYLGKARRSWGELRKT